VTENHVTQLHAPSSPKCEMTKIKHNFCASDIVYSLSYVSSKDLQRFGMICMSSFVSTKNSPRSRCFEKMMVKMIFWFRWINCFVYGSCSSSNV
jgi:hypothetical protein